MLSGVWVYLTFIAGLAMIVICADSLVDGASAIARKLNISEFIIGLTIVGFGTSCPELVVSLTGAFKGISDIAIGNVLGSNIFNSLLILGITAVIAPISISQKNKLRDIPITLFVTIALILFGVYNNDISRLEGVLFFLLFICYIYYCFKNDSGVSEDIPQKELSLAKAILFTIIGLCGLILGGKLFVESASEIAKILGVSDKFIAITVLAGGTSLPELATCIIASAKKKGQLALGNILGSNVFNILLIIGCSSIVTPLSFASINFIDLAVLLLSAILIYTSAFIGKKNSIDRFDGIIFLLCEAAYFTYLVATA